MFTVAILADLHLPDAADTVKETVLDWALTEAKAQKVDLIVGAGDLTGTGTEAAAMRIRLKLEKTKIPFLLTPGNAEMRDPAWKKRSSAILATPRQYDHVVLLDSSTRMFAARDRELLKELTRQGGQNLLAVTHCPMATLDDGDRKLLEQAASAGTIGQLVAGHYHSDTREVKYSLVRGLDPDKAAGGAPALALFTLDDSGNWSRRDIACPAADPRLWPENERREWLNHLGISGMAAPLDSLALAVEAEVPAFEFRYDSIAKLDVSLLLTRLAAWRRRGGRYLSLQLPDLRWRDGILEGDVQIARASELAVELHCDSVAIHAPRVKLSVFRRAPEVRQLMLEKMCALLKPVTDAGIVVGVENLHMSARDHKSGDRGFGYTPEECREWIEVMRAVAGTPRIGLQLDIGHVRNNAPYSSLYTLSQWYASMGREVVGFHLHQIRVEEDGSYTNHAALSGLFGKLISLSSLFMAWRAGQLNHAPMFLEIREGSSFESCQALRRELDICS